MPVGLKDVCDQGVIPVTLQPGSPDSHLPPFAAGMQSSFLDTLCKLGPGESVCGRGARLCVQHGSIYIRTYMKMIIVVSMYVCTYSIRHTNMMVNKNWQRTLNIYLVTVNGQPLSFISNLSVMN